MKRFKRMSTVLARTCVQVVYYVSAALFPVRQKKVTFASYRAESLKGNLLFIYEELERRKEGYHCHFLLKKYNSSVFGKADYFFHMARASYHLATSRYFLIDDYYFPAYVIQPRKGTEIIQVWHAAGAFKKFGHSTMGRGFGPSQAYLKLVKVHGHYAKAIVSSSEVVPHFAEAFDMPASRVLPLGVPRTDYFFQEDEHEKVKDRFYKQYPELEGKKLILYAPTFRGKSHVQDQPFRCPFDIRKLRQELGEGYALLIHLHPYMRGGVQLDDQIKDFAYQIETGFQIEELMVLSDRLVTDYSSVIFDYSLLSRPIAFFADDLEAYIKERDFYYSYRAFIPGPLFTETEPFAEWIKEAHPDLRPVEAFRDRFFDEADGKASKRVVDHIFGLGNGQ